MDAERKPVPDLSNATEDDIFNLLMAMRPGEKDPNAVRNVLDEIEQRENQEGLPSSGLS